MDRTNWKFSNTVVMDSSGDSKTVLFETDHDWYAEISGGDGWLVNIVAMVLFGIAIGVLISFIGGLMAVDLVPREAPGAALGIVGLASSVAAGLSNIISGWLIDGQAVRDELTGEIIQYDFTYVSAFWVAAAVISFLLPILNWKLKKQEI